MLGAAAYDAARFSVNTDIEGLISQSLPWHPTSTGLSQRLPAKRHFGSRQSAHRGECRTGHQHAGAGAGKKSEAVSAGRATRQRRFSERNGMLFDSPADVKKSIAGLTQARALLSVLAGRSQPARGHEGAPFGARGRGRQTQDRAARLATFARGTDLERCPVRKARDIFLASAAAGPCPANQAVAAFCRSSARARFRRRCSPAAWPPRGFIGRGRSRSSGKFGAKVDLTGQVPMNDDQFSVIRQSALRDTLTAVFGVLIILWLALRSWKIIAAVFFSLMVGLAATAALGLAMVGSFNLISISFFVLFVGLGVDFGIQFSVRYRSERHEHSDLRGALRGRRPQGRRSARVGRRGHRRGIFRISADQLSRPFGARTDCRLRHADRVHLQHHAGAGDADDAQSAG